MKPSFALMASCACALLGSATAAPSKDGLYAEVTTPRGKVTAELFYRIAPMTVSNFVGLAEGTLGPKADGTPFYDGLTFHRVVEDFVVQGGDPTGTGESGAGYSFPDEITPALLHSQAGVVQMANDGPDSNSSQWCFMLRATPHLNYLHSVFGQVVDGLEILPTIQQGDTMQVKILRIGKDAEAFQVTKDSFAHLTSAAKTYQGPREPGPDAPFDDPGNLLPTDWPRAKAFTCKLANFERFTGHRVAARVLPKAPATEVEIASYLNDTAGKLQLGPAGLLAVYYADQDRWHFLIGQNAAKILPGGPSEAESRLIKLTHERQDQMISASLKRLPAGQSELPPSTRIRAAVDSMLDQVFSDFNNLQKP